MVKAIGEMDRICLVYRFYSSCLIRLILDMSLLRKIMHKNGIKPQKTSGYK